jgi:molybdopterin-biosynthesis enzyme MoeA-like protein
MKKELLSVGLTIIGDEILSGRRIDKHFAHSINYFQELAIDICWATYLGDDAKTLADHFRRVRKSEDITFSFGGIGATPDDLTRQSMAAAHDVEMIRHPEAVKLIEGRFGDGAYPNRILMAELPEGCQLIPNEFNQIPGFSMGNIHCLPGFPEMAWSMMDWVVRTAYQLPENRDLYFCSLIVKNVRESEIITLLERVQKQFPDCKISSLPRFPAEGSWQTELGVCGQKIVALEVMDVLRRRLLKNGYEISSKEH